MNLSLRSNYKGNLSLLFLFLGVLIFLIIVYFNFSKNNVNFVSPSKIIKLLSNDEDQFFRNFTELDLKARKYSNLQDYLAKIKRSFIEVEDSIKSKIIKLSKEADKLLFNKYPDMSKLGWNIIIFKGKEYEDGSPHVRFNTIFLPLDMIKIYPDQNLIQTLIHEKIHLFQKKYPSHPYLIEYLKNYKKYKLRKDLQKENQRIRSNPDLDDWVYFCLKDNKVLYQEFRGDNPVTLYDTIQSGKDEHPYERMAYSISEDLTA